jgi:hypothetical protein
MVANEVHAVVLLTHDRDSARIVTDLDVVRAALRDSAGITAAELAREPLATVVSSAPLEQAIALMARREDAHILVSEPGPGWPAGILSSLDVMAVSPVATLFLRVRRLRRPLVSGTSSTGRPSPRAHPGVDRLPDDSVERAPTMADLRIHCVAVGAVRRDGVTST